MTRAQYAARYSAMLTADKSLEIPDMDSYIDVAITAGVQMFCAASAWRFKRVIYTPTISSTADSYDLPDEFESVIAVYEQSSVQGRKLQFYEEDQFIELFPLPSSHPSGTPLSYTIFNDAVTNKQKIAFYPRPSGGETIKIICLKAFPLEPDVIPALYQGGVDVAIALACYPLGHVGRAQARAEFDAEVRRLEVVSKVDQSTMMHFPDTTSDQAVVPNKYGWINR